MLGGDYNFTNLDQKGIDELRQQLASAKERISELSEGYALSGYADRLRHMGNYVVALENLLRQLYHWDMMDVAGDGKFWRAEIDKVLAACPFERRKDMGSRADNYKHLGPPHIKGA